VTGKKKYLDEDEKKEKYGLRKKAFPEKALGPGGRIGPLRQKYIAKHLKIALAKGGCLLVIGSTHIKGKSGTHTEYKKTETKTGRTTKKRIEKKYTTPSLHELLTGEKGELLKVKTSRGTYTVQVIKKSLIK
jgi:hypothetical protein